jgi:hypothetical protein
VAYGLLTVLLGGGHGRLRDQVDLDALPASC